MSDNLKAIGNAAGLSAEEKRKLDEFDKALQMHKTLSKMPADAANQKYNTLTPSQQVSLQKNFGNEDPTIAPKRGWFGTAAHYVGSAIGAVGSDILGGLNNVSDAMTRLYRTGAIAVDQGVSLSDAWTLSNDKGDKVFSPNRIIDAKTKFGNTAVDVAMRIASGEKPEAIAATATPEELKYLKLADPRNTVIDGIAPDQVEAARGLFQDTLDAVQAAKYSPGRQIANLVTPAELEGSGLYYKAVSGAVDAAYRIFMDPLLIAGKAKRAIDVTKYAVDVVVGKGKVAEVFARPAVKAFWDQYGAGLEAYTKAQAAGKVEEALQIRKQLGTLAPEFGDAVIKSFQKADIPVTNAKTAQAFFDNAKQLDETLKGGAGRQRVIIPRMNPLRQMRIAAVTTGRKVFNIDAVGPKLVDDYFFGGATTTDGIAEKVINGQKEIVDQVTAKTNFKGIARFSTAYIQHRIDRAKAAFTQIPIFGKDLFDVTADDAPQKIYQLSLLVMPLRESRLLSQAFNDITDVGKRKDIYYGLWDTIAEIRGLKTTAPGQQIGRYLIGKTGAKFGLDEFSEKGSMPSDFNNMVTAPGMQDLDRAAARNTLVQKMIGLANSDFANKMTSAWSFLTLAGPRYALRNAGEDLMVNLAIGNSPWGLAKKYHLNNRVNTFLSAAQKVEGEVRWFDNPLGAILRVTNKRDVKKYTTELTDIKNKFETGKEKLDALRRDALALPKTSPEYISVQSEIAAIEKELEGGIAEQVRQVFARALVEGRVNRWRSSLGMKAVNQEEADILREHILFGELDNTLGDVSEGSLNTFMGNDFLTRAENLINQTGVSSHALTIKPSGMQMVRAKGERSFTEKALHQQDEGSMYSWMFSISRYANDELGSIAVANLDEPAIAIKKMTDWMAETPQGKKFLSDARLANDMTAEEIARLNFKRARDLFLKRDKTLNEDLLNKIRVKDKNGEWSISGKIGIEDLPTNPDDLPELIVGPTLVPAVPVEEITSNVVQHGWTFLGLSNARMSRQPMVLNEIVNTRKQFKKSGFENKWIEAYQRGIDPANTAKMEIAREKALKDLTRVVEERATSQIINYVDNPLVRSQLAWNLRNFARFYRATEDFYRRMYRVVKYNPEAIVKAALTYEGITHSGWIQQDDQGESYFVYPGIAPVYNAVQDTLTRLGIGDKFKVPMPVNFGANVKMLTPSLNPDSLVPTFSGPVSGLSFTVITQLISGLGAPGAADTIKGYAMGKYSVDQPIVSAFLPAHINRLYSAMNQDDRNSQYASAWRKAVTYLEASGNGLPKKYDQDGNLIPPTPGEQEAYRLRVKNTVIGILGMRFVFGFFAPASPQVQLKSDMAQWISDNGRANFKQLFNKLLDQYPGDYDKAMAKWVELYPNQIPFTLTESERKSLAPLRYAEEAGNFVDQNKDLFKQYPGAAAFLIPHKTGFSWDAYKTMKDEGLLQNKRVDDYLREVQTAADLQEYYAKKDEYDAALANSIADFQRTQIRQEFDSWKKVFFAGRPLVQEELSQGSQKAIKRLQTVDELNNMLNANLNIRPKTENALREMMKVYNDYKSQKESFEAMNVPNQLIDNLQSTTLSRLQQLSEYNENTKAAYQILFSRLPGIGN